MRENPDVFSRYTGFTYVQVEDSLFLNSSITPQKMCPRHQKYVIRSHFQRMKSLFGFKACRRFKSTIFATVFHRQNTQTLNKSLYQATESPQLGQDPLLNHFKAPEFPAKHLETGHLDNVKIFTPGPFFKTTSPEMQARPSSRQPPPKFYALRTPFCHPGPFSLRSTEEKHPTFSAMFCKQR